MTGITFLASPFFTRGRAGAKIDSIVLHWMVGTLASTDREFAHGSRRVSAHYGIEGATKHQYVKDADTAWHAGDHAENIRSIGIEHSAAPGRPATAATLATSVDLIVDLCRKYEISPDHIYPHKKFFPTACPGTLPIADIIARVRAQLTHPAPTTPEDDMLTPEAQTWIEARMDAHDAYIIQNLRSAVAAASNPTALAKAVAAALPATGAITQPMLEAALRTVLGSVDGK